MKKSDQKNLIIIILIFFIILSFIGNIFTAGSYGMVGMMMFNPFIWFGMGGFGFIYMLVFWVLLLWLIVYLVREFDKPKRRR